MASACLRVASGVMSGSFRSAALFVVLLLTSLSALAGDVTLAWDPVAGASGYVVYHGPAAGNYTSNQDVGNVTTYTVPNLAEGATYHFAVTAYDGSHTETGYSNSVSTTVPNSAPVAQFSASTTSGTAPLAMNFLNNSIGSIAIYLWNFGDGTTSAVRNPSHVYAAPGVYTVSLTVISLAGILNVMTKSNYVTVTAPPTAPVAAFSANVTSGVAPLAVNFASSSTGNITSYAWNFGDGTSSNASNPTRVYSSPGVYAVTLTVNGPGGSHTLTKNNYITVTAAPSTGPPVAAFLAEIRSGAAPLAVNFTNSSTGNITSHAWSFGDGDTSSEKNPTHVYTSEGVYTVRLTVSGPEGSKTVTKRRYVTVADPPSTPPPVAAFAANVTSGAAPLAVNFTSSSTGSIATHAWSFGDGTASNAPNPVHVYSSPGVYTVSLTVSGPGGSHTKTLSNYITVTSVPASGCPCSLWNSGATPDTAADPDTVPVELGVKFRSDRNGSIAGIRFYKSSSNIGTHVASLWTTDGTLLARATFTNETASGWQQVNFATPVAITANTVYVASYHTNVGRYASDDYYFANTGVDNGPLHALRSQFGQGNGVYSYSASPSFPSSSYLATNYWVDVVFH